MSDRGRPERSADGRMATGVATEGAASHLSSGGKQQRQRCDRTATRLQSRIARSHRGDPRGRPSYSRRPARRQHCSWSLTSSNERTRWTTGQRARSRRGLRLCAACCASSASTHGRHAQQRALKRRARPARAAFLVVAFCVWQTTKCCDSVQSVCRVTDCMLTLMYS